MGGVIINLVAMSRNIWREWGGVRQTTNGVHITLLLSKSGGRGGYMERLSAKYRKIIEDQKVSIWVEAQRRSVSGEEASDRAMERSRANN